MLGGLRVATVADAAQLLAIYGPYVLNTTVTFETQVPTEQAFAGRIAGTLAQFPYLVWESAGEIAGYAYAHRFAERAAYDWAAEASIYLAPAVQGTGVAQCLYGALIELMQAMNYAHLYGIITHPNPRSESFHKSMGFELTAYLPNVGYKMNRWVDVVYYRLPLCPLPTRPVNVIPFANLPQRLVRRVLMDRSAAVSHE